MKEPGYHSDGGNLWLRVAKSGSKSWSFIYTRGGTTRQMGLGSLHKVSLEKARQKATEARAVLGDDQDPINARQDARDADALTRARRMTFCEASKKFIASRSQTWRNLKHVQQWQNTLEQYCFPVFGHLPVAEIDTSLVMKAIEPLWLVKNETAMRLRGRVESVLDWAKAREFRTGDNPARYRGHLDTLLAKVSRKERIEHHPAMPFGDVADFLVRLRETDGAGALALRFLILTATRTGEVIGARWEEIDMAGRVWTIPATRMKVKREHRVPLSDGAMEVLNQLEATRAEGAEYLFPSRDGKKAMSNMAMLQLMRRMNLEAVPHGFRSSFRDWAAERTNFPREVCEAALAHTLENKTEAAYFRTDLFDKRVKLMAAWNSHCSIQAATVTPIARTAA